MTALRVGLIGANVHAGWGGSVHARVINALPGLELAAVATAHRETAEESARHFGARFAFDDFRAMAAHPEVDLVAVAVRVPFHHQMVMAALEAGKHIFCEWPLAATLAEAEEMASLARARGVRHVVGLQNRADPAHEEARHLIAGGYVGKVVTARLTQIAGGGLEREQRRAYQVDPSLGAHYLSITAGHAIDSFRYALGEEITELVAQVRTQIPRWRLRETGETVTTTSPDNILVAGTLESGATASVTVASVPYLGAGSSFEAYGAEGTLTVTAERGGLVLRGGQGAASALEVLPVEDREPVPEELRRGPTANVARLYQRLAASITGGETVEPNFDTAVSLHRLLAAIERSSASGARTTLD
jgi:predicted dehydrogenase